MQEVTKLPSLYVMELVDLFAGRLDGFESTQAL